MKKSNLKVDFKTMAKNASRFLFAQFSVSNFEKLCSMLYSLI